MAGLAYSTSPDAVMQGPMTEKTIAAVALHSSSQVAKCMEMVEQIENSLFGPSPANDVNCKSPMPNCLASTIDDTAERIRSMAIRLESIASRVGG